MKNEFVKKYIRNPIFIIFVLFANFVAIFLAVFIWFFNDDSYIKILKDLVFKFDEIL